MALDPINRSALEGKHHQYDALLESFISQALELYGIGRDLGPCDSICCTVEGGAVKFYDDHESYTLTHWDALSLMQQLYHLPLSDRWGYFWDYIGQYENLEDLQYYE